MEIKQKDYNQDRTLEKLKNGQECHFMNENNRAFMVIQLKKLGLIPEKSVSNNQQIHPEYVEDYKGDIETGFGNTMYQTFFKKLYNLKVRWI